MRITNGMMQSTVLNSLYTNMNSMNKLYEQMSTLKKIQKPSDDPIIAGRTLKLRLNVLETEQHEKNVKEASSWMSVTESALTNMQEILKDIRTRCAQGANDSLTTEDREKICDDINQLYQQLQQESNATYAGRYVFSGYKTNQPMFVDDPDNLPMKMLNAAGGRRRLGVVRRLPGRRPCLFDRCCFCASLLKANLSNLCLYSDIVASADSCVFELMYSSPRGPWLVI